MSWILSLSCISLACMMMILYLNYVMFVKSTKRELLLSFWQWNKWFCYGVNYFLSNKRKCLSNSVIRKHKLQCKFGTTVQWGTVIACLFVFCHFPGICPFVWQKNIRYKNILNSNFGTFPGIFSDLFFGTVAGFIYYVVLLLLLSDW